jgi:hypothetical protein
MVGMVRIAMVVRMEVMVRIAMMRMAPVRVRAPFRLVVPAEMTAAMMVATVVGARPRTLVAVLPLPQRRRRLSLVVRRLS